MTADLLEPSPWNISLVYFYSLALSMRVMYFLHRKFHVRAREDASYSCNIYYIKKLQILIEFLLTLCSTYLSKGEV